MDLSQLSDSDLQALAVKDFSKVSTEGLQYLANPSRPKPTVQAKEAGFSLRDIGTAFGQGAIGSAEALTNVAGAGNVASQYLGDVSKSLGEKYTPERQAEMQRQQQRMKKAEESGSTWEEIKAGAQNIYEAPLQSAAQGLGSFVPYVPAMFAGPVAAALGLSSRAVVAANVVAKAYAPVIGTAQGAGSVKGAIYDAVYKAEKKSGFSEAEARQKATAAQDYTGKNLDQIALGAGLGYVASKGGIEKFLTKEGREKAAEKIIPRVVKATTEESVTEGAQGGQERLASNIALQRTGRDVPTFQGVGGQAAQEAITAALTAGAVSIPQSGKAPVEDLTKRASTTAGQEALDVLNPPPPPPPIERVKDVEPVINPPVGTSVPVVDGRGVTPAPERIVPPETVGVGSTLRTPVPDTARDGEQPAALNPDLQKIYDAYATYKGKDMQGDENLAVHKISRLTDLANIHNQPINVWLHQGKIVTLGASVPKPKFARLIGTVNPTGEAPAATEVVTPPQAPATQQVAEIGDYHLGLAPELSDTFERLQNRDRAGQRSVAQMKDISNKADYDRLSVDPNFGSGAPVVISDFKLPQIQLGKTDVATAVDGRKVPVQYAVVSANDLLPSHTSDGQVNSTYADTSVSAIRPVAGNGRVAGFQEGYGKSSPAMADYAAKMALDPRHGIDPNVIKATPNPVLIRIMPKTEITRNIGDVSNVSTGLELSPLEKAKNDANRLDLSNVEFEETEDGSLKLNKKSANQFIQAMPENERGTMVDSRGEPNTVAMDRLRNAMFWKAYNSDRLGHLYTEATDPEAKLILSAMQKAVPKMVQLEGAGIYDVRPNVVEAAEMAVNARRRGVPLKDLVNQEDMTRDPTTQAILEMFASHSRSGNRMGDLLGRFADEAYKDANVTEDMFGEKPQRPLNEIAEALKPAEEEVKLAPPEEKKAPPKLDESKITPKKGRHPQMQAAAKLLQEGKMTREEFEKYSDYYKPIEQIEAEKLLPPTSDEKMLETVDSGKRDKVNVPIEDGTIVGLRMDLPARERGGAVVSIHEGKPGLKTLGKLLSFKNVAHLVGGKDGRVTFEPRSQEKGLGVAIGENKAPQQTVEGKWKNVTAEAAYAKVKELMGNPAWSQIGFDPSRHGYFYDRKTREPVKSASEVYQVGQFLLAKDVEFAPKSEFLYSLRGKSEGQITAFEQSLRTLLNKFGLKDVGLKLSEGMRDEGSYAAKLIQIAADSANPIRALRHESVHALRELGFFTDAQWNSLSKMAKDKWIDQYLKQRDVDGKPLKAGEESRYDAYMREYKGDMEKITEEAVADAFADFDTKPPAGMIQAILQKLRNLFQSIRSALTKMESAEQIFSKAEKGALKPKGKQVKGEANADIRKNLRSQAGEEKAGTDKGQEALNITGGLGRVSAQPDSTYMEKVREAWDNATDNPKATAAEVKSAVIKFIDLIQTKAFSSDAAINNSIRRQVNEFVKDNEQAIGTMLNISQSQVVHADALANLFLTSGNLKYNKELYKYEAVEDKANIVELAKQLGEIKDKYGLTQAQTELIGHTAFEAKRLKSLLQFNNQVDQEVAAMRAEADKLDMDAMQDLLNPLAAQPGKETAANALREKATRRSKDKKFIHMTAAEIAAGNKLFKIIPELNGVVDTWNQMRDNAANMLVDSGLWSKEEAEFLLSNADYVPFFREEQLEKGKGPKEYIRGLMVQAQEKKLKGSNKPVNDIFDNMNRWMQYSVNRAVRNRSALSLIDTAAEFGQAKKIASKADGENAVRVWRNGKEEFYNMADPMFVEAFTGLESITIPAWKWASTVANILRQSVVLNPLFTVAQIPQDSFAAMFTSGLKPQYALQIPVRAVKEFAKTLVHRSATNNDLKKYGVVGVRDFTSQMARLDAQVYAGMKASPGILGKLKSSLEHIAMAGDNAVRQATYEAALAQKLSKAEALEKSFEIWNIRRKGTSQSLAIASQVIPFFGAYLAAQNVALKTISGVGTSPTERKAALGALVGTTASVMTLSLLYAMMNGDDEDYLKKPAAIRDRMLMVPGTNGFGIPLRSDLFSIPKIITEHMYLMITDKGYEDGRKFRDSMANALGNSFLSPTVVPQAIKPGLEVLVNYDFFQGRPLIGEYQKRLEKERQFNESTSEIAKMMGKFGVSPIAADHLMRGMFGSAGGLVIYMTNPLLHSDPNVDKPTMSTKDMLATLPGASSFVSKEKESALKADFYVLRDEVGKVTNTLSDLKQRSPEKIAEYIADPDVMAKLGVSKAVQGIDRKLGEIRKAMTRISNLPTSVMDSDEKQKQIKQLRESETEMLKAINVKNLREMAKI